MPSARQRPGNRKRRDTTRRVAPVHISIRFLPGALVGGGDTLISVSSCAQVKPGLIDLPCITWSCMCGVGESSE